MIYSSDLEHAMTAAGATPAEVDTEFLLIGDLLIAWANKEPGCADPVSDGGWDANFANEVWDNLHATGEQK